VNLLTIVIIGVDSHHLPMFARHIRAKISGELFVSAPLKLSRKKEESL
jgi:hypothetical protein